MSAHDDDSDMDDGADTPSEGGDVAAGGADVDVAAAGAGVLMTDGDPRSAKVPVSCGTAHGLYDVAK